jgi:hypothetical protein
MRLIKYFIILFFIISCNNKEKEVEKIKYQILNLIYSGFSKHQMEFFVFPAKPLTLPKGINSRKLLNNKVYMDSLHKIVYSNKITREDSLLKIKNHLENKENQQIFAFDLKMEKYHNLNDKTFDKNIKGFENLYKKFINSNKIDSLSINKILAINNDSIIKFKKELLKDKVGVEFRKFNILISFSDISYNKEILKAIVIGTKVFNATDSHSSIYFLEKENRKWKLKYEISI